MIKNIEIDFPFEFIDSIAEIEIYRKEINRPIYHIHKYWAKRLGSVFRSIVLGSLKEDNDGDFYDVYNFKNKIVLDPFMGSGTTLGESLKLGTKVIGSDVNPLSTFIVKQSLTNVSRSDLIQEYHSIENDVKDKILSLYTTQNPKDGSETQGIYYFWVKVVKTPKGEEIPFFSSYIFSKNAYPKKKPISHIFCPNCEDIIQDRYDSTSTTCPSCEHNFNPQCGPVKGSKVIDSNGIEYKIKELQEDSNKPPLHKLYSIMIIDNGIKKYIKPTIHDHDRISEIEKMYDSQKGKLPLPEIKVRIGHNTNQARGYNYLKWRDFFNKRQLLAHGILLDRILLIPNDGIREQFITLFSGVLEFNNLFCSYKGEGTGAVRHMFSNHILKPERTPLENTVWGIEGKSSGTFSTLFKSRLLKAKDYLENPFEIKIIEKNGKRKTEKVVCSNPLKVRITDNPDDFFKKDSNALILNGDSSNLPIPSESVDSVITDPPYYDFIHYSELSDFFFSWLSSILKKRYPYFNKNDSSHPNEVQDKDHEKFSEKIKSIFLECNRVLKPDGLLCFSYHHSTIDGWMAIYDSITQYEFHNFQGPSCKS